MRINNNVMAFNAARHLSSTAITLGKSLETLSSGLRINRAADDAAGLVISQGLRAQISGIRQATRNAQDGISVVQTAEGALTEVHAALIRMRELAVQAANTGANDVASRAAAQAELKQLTEEIGRITSTTSFGGQKLLDGSIGSYAYFEGSGAATVDAVTGIVTTNWIDGGRLNFGEASHVVGTVQATYTSVASYQAALQASIGAAVSAHNADVGSTYQAAVYVSRLSSDGRLGVFLRFDGAEGVLATAPLRAALGLSESFSIDHTGGTFQIGADASDTLNAVIGDLGIDAPGGLMLSTLDLNSDAGWAIAALDGAVSRVSSERGRLGSLQNRFEAMTNSLSITAENLAASESRIRDTDMAAAMVGFTRAQVLQQAGAAMLAQANQVHQVLLALLR